jgi:predicted Ser/Thr protein kinase
MLIQVRLGDFHGPQKKVSQNQIIYFFRKKFNNELEKRKFKVKVMKNKWNNRTNRANKKQIEEDNISMQCIIIVLVLISISSLHFIICEAFYFDCTSTSTISRSTRTSSSSIFPPLLFIIAPLHRHRHRHHYHQGSRLSRRMVTFVLLQEKSNNVSFSTIHKNTTNHKKKTKIMLHPPSSSSSSSSSSVESASETSTSTSSSRRMILKNAINIANIIAVNINLPEIGMAFASPTTNTSTSTSITKSKFDLYYKNDEFLISSLRYKKLLGKGTFKTVYSVFLSTTRTDDTSTGTSTSSTTNLSHYQYYSYYAMAVEQLRSKSEARDELRGIRIVEHIQTTLALRQSPSEYEYPNINYSKYFESIYTWWIQSLPVAKYDVEQVPNQFVFPISNKGDSARTSTSDSNNDSNSDGDKNNTLMMNRTRKRPTSFIGKTHYLISLKPLYDIDLKSFSRKCPLLYPILPANKYEYDSNKDNDNSVHNSVHNSEDILMIQESAKENFTLVEGICLNNKGALKLIYELCQAGRIMHDELGIIHRDIKPKNIMISDGHAVIIDFGFADFGTFGERNSEGTGRCCITEVGKVKGEVNYVIAQDVKLYRGCREGDTYAMGRTIYEVLFAEYQQEVVDSGKKPITFESSTNENQRFRKVLVEALEASVENYRDGTNTMTSRFRLTADVHNCILSVVEGLCRSSIPLSFRDAEDVMKKFMNNKQQSWS